MKKWKNITNNLYFLSVFQFSDCINEKMLWSLICYLCGCFNVFPSISDVPRWACWQHAIHQKKISEYDAELRIQTSSVQLCTLVWSQIWVGTACVEVAGQFFMKCHSLNLLNLTKRQSVIFSWEYIYMLDLTYMSGRQ